MKNIDRRGFLKTGLAGAAGIALAPAALGADLKSPEGEIIYRTLGKTGLKVPVISFGVMRSDNPGLCKAAYEKGIKLFDTANGYQNGFYDVGTHHFDGATAILFARIREGYSDLDRIDHQTIILNALYQRLTSEEIRPRLLAIATEFILTNQVLTDFAPSDLPALICLATHLDRDRIKVATLPSDTFTAQTLLGSNKVDRVFYFIPDLPRVIQVFNNFKTGLFP